MRGKDFILWAVLLLPHLKRVFLIVNEENYSSAEAFVFMAKYTGFATLIGTRTSGSGIGSDPILLKLPKSHLIVRIPVFKGVNPDGTSNNTLGTAPDIAVPGINDYSLSTIRDLIGRQALKGEKSPGL